MTPEGTKRRGSSLLALVVVIIILAAGLGYLYVNLSSQESTVSSLDSVITAQGSSISSQSNALSSLSGVASSQSQAISSQSASLTSESAEASSQAATISSQSSTISSLSSAISAQSGVVEVESNSISSLTQDLNLTQSTQEVASQPFSTGSAGEVNVTTFTAKYSGYVVVTLSAASDFANEGIQLANNFSASVNSPDYVGIVYPASGFFVPFGSTTDSVVIPVAPGTVTVNLLTSDDSAQTATLSVTYYY
ncbi:MAG: hypothetical protein OK456_03630 [Thaumarchaeota archaeon]|nr:hypothetical protein [Nitrososphaerota archaeon]